jgi:hypothetical protein
LSAGIHILEWRFSKDYIIDRGADRAAIWVCFFCLTITSFNWLQYIDILTFYVVFCYVLCFVFCVLCCFRWLNLVEFRSQKRHVIRVFLALTMTGQFWKRH